MNCQCINFPIRAGDYFIEVHRDERFYRSVYSTRIYDDPNHRNGLRKLTLELIYKDTFSNRIVTR